VDSTGTAGTTQVKRLRQVSSTALAVTLSAPSPPASMPTLDVWEGMPHGFVNSISQLAAAAQALDTSGAFLAEPITDARAVQS
jgi:hypothetical protein